MKTQFVLLGLVCAACVARAELVWSTSRFASVSNNVLRVCVPKEKAREGGRASTVVDVSQFADKSFVASVLAEGRDISEPRDPWNGLKFMLRYKDAKTGEMCWPNTARRLGSFDRRTIKLRADFGAHPPKDGKVELIVGLQDSSGELVCDLSSLRFEEVKSLFHPQNVGYRVEYPERVRNAPRLRGVMLPSRPCTEEDFRTLSQWGATLARYQMIRNWHKVGDNRDTAEFDRWLDGKLDHLELVLKWAKEYGLKIVVDLHVAPGGRNDDKEMNMFFEPKYADHFVECWKRIATRFKGRPEIYGFDLINEPVQKEEAKEDYWKLQERAAKAVRAIDPDTPIIMESNEWDSAEAYKYMSPLAMPNVIYQVHMYVPGEFTHQGVHAKDGKFKREKWPDASKGWDRDFIRKRFAPVKEFQEKTGAKIYVGEFSAIVWAEGAENYLRDVIAVMEEYGWDWTYHAFREWNGWSVEHEGENHRSLRKAKEETARKKVLLDGLRAPQPWRLGKDAKIDGSLLKIDAPSDRGQGWARKWVDLRPYMNKSLIGTIPCSAENVSVPKQNWNGIKFMMHYFDETTGQNIWQDTSGPKHGSFGERPLNFVSDFSYGRKAAWGELTLGMQSSNGRLTFDLSRLEMKTTEALFPITNATYKTEYPAAISARPRMRGAMLSPGRSTKADLSVLASWGATMARYQICRNWGKWGDNNPEMDLDDYDKWFAAQLDHLAEVLDNAKELGLKIAIDLHTPPGGRLGNRDMAMFHDEKYAARFVECWRQIARRFKGHPAVYGYDLINEPSQSHPSKTGGYWGVQDRAARAVREIDQDTPIIVESNEWDSARAFSYLNALALPNVIYQAHMYVPMQFTHQGVGGSPTGNVWPDASKGWTKDLLYKTLAPVRKFQLAHNCKIYIGEFSAIAPAKGAETYLQDVIDIMEEYGWDWTYHAFREWNGWSVEHEGEDLGHLRPSQTNPRKETLLRAFKRK